MSAIAGCMLPVNLPIFFPLRQVSVIAIRIQDSSNRLQPAP